MAGDSEDNVFVEVVLGMISLIFFSLRKVSQLLNPVVQVQIGFAVCFVM